MAVKYAEKVTVKQTNGGVGFFGFLTLLFIALKLTGVISWSWWWILAPLWMPFAGVLAFVAICFALAGVAWVISEVIKKSTKENDK